MSAEQPALAIDPTAGDDATARLERAVLAALDVPIEHLEEAEEERWDARTTAPFTARPRLQVYAERLTVPAGLPVEIKVCRRWIADRHSGQGRRRGRWEVQQASHEALVEHFGWYLLAVREGGRVLGALMLPARRLPEPTWTTSDTQGRRRGQVRWADLLDPDRLVGGGRDG